MYQAIYTASFLGAACGYMLSISISLFLTYVKQSGPFIIGLAGFTGNFVYTVMTFLLSRYSKSKIHPLFFYSPLIMGISYFSILFSPVPLIFLFLVIGGATCAFFWPSLQNCLSATDDDLRIGIYNLCWAGGVIVGSFSAGFLYSVSPFLPFTSGLLLYIINAFILFSNKDKLIIQRKDIYRERIEKPLSQDIVRDIRILNFINFFAMGSIFFLYPKLGTIRGFTPQFIGSVIGILLISRFVTFFLLMDKPLILHPARFILSCLFLCISCILVGYGTSPITIITGVVIMGIAGAFAYHNSLQMHIKYNLKTEINESLIGAGVFSGSLIAGILGQIFNLPLAYVIIGTFILISGLWYSRMSLFGLINRQSNTS